MSKLLDLLTVWYLSESLNVMIVWYMPVHPSTRPKITTKVNLLLDDELESSQSDSLLNVTLRAFPLFLLKLWHSFL